MSSTAIDIFGKLYEECQQKCIDPRFEKFYKDLVYGLDDRKSCH